MVDANGSIRMDLIGQTLMPWLSALGGGSLHGLSILDIASNDGTLSALLAEAGADVTGLEIRESLVELSRERTAHLASPPRFVVGDVVDLDASLAGQMFDVVLFMGLLYHLPNPISTMRSVSTYARRALVVDTHVHFDTDASREAMPSFWMLPDSDWPTLDGALPQDPRGSADEIRAAHEQGGVVWTTLPSRFVPPPPLAAEAAVSDALTPPPAGSGIPLDYTAGDPGQPVMVPNRAAVRDLFRASGWSSIAELVPPRFALRPYLLKHRATFLAIR